MKVLCKNNYCLRNENGKCIVEDEIEIEQDESIEDNMNSMLCLSFVPNWK